MNKELRLEAKKAISEKRKKAFPAFFAECFLLALPFTALILLNRFGFSAALSRNPWLTLGIAAAVLFVMILCFRAFNARLFLEQKGKGQFVSVLRALLLELLLVLIKAGLLLLCLLPFFAMTFFFLKAAGDEFPLSAASVIGAFAVSLLALGVFFYRRFSSFLFLAPYILCSDNCTILESIKKSIQSIDGNAERFIGLKRSFFGWFLLCLLVFPAVYVWSYYKLTEAIFAEGLI